MLYSSKPELLRQISWLVPDLPEFQPIELRGEADYYGASTEIAHAVGLATAPVASATWKHGWSIVPPTNAVAESQYQSGPKVHLTSNRSRETFLLENGYPNACAVGLPFLYAQPKVLERRGGSLLVAPFHSLPEITPAAEQKENEEVMARYLVGLREKFSCVCACLHYSCVTSRLWIDTFEAHGIPWVVGARTDDANGLRRVKMLLSVFDVVLSNQVSSVLVYGASVGARVCVAGPLAALPPVESFAKHPHYIKHPELLKNLALQHPDAIRERYPFLFGDPADAICHKQWASDELGVDCILPVGDIARLLGWRFVEGDPVWEGWDRRKAMANFVWLPPVIGSQDNLEKVGQILEKDGVGPSGVVEHLRGQREALKQLGKTAKSGAKDQAELSSIKSSWAWRYLAKPFFSIEKRLRGKK